MPIVKIKQLHPDAKQPTYATDGSGCFDLYSVEPAEFSSSMVFRTGLAFGIPEGYVMLVFSRSGHGFKSGVRLANCVGVIDSDFVQEVMIKLACDTEDGFSIKKGDRIAQACIIPYPKVEFEFVDSLMCTTRVGGFGSTGA